MDEKGGPIPHLKVKMSVVAMLRNEERFLKMALDSVAKYAYEIIAFDTGSTDKTIEILRQYPVEIFRDKLEPAKFEKPGSWKYTAIRQFLLSRCRGDIVLQLDGDEVWPIETVRELVLDKATNEDYWAFRCPWINFVGSYQRSKSGWYKGTCKAIRNMPEITYGDPFPFEVFKYNHSPLIGKTRVIAELENPIFHFGQLKEDYWRKGTEFDYAKAHHAEVEEYRNPMIEKYGDKLGWPKQ